VIAKSGDGQQETRVGTQVVSLLSGQAELRDACVLVGLGTTQAEQPADGCRIDAQQVVFDAHREIGIVIGRILREQFLGQRSELLIVLKAARFRFSTRAM